MSRDKENTLWAHSMLGYIAAFIVVFWWFVHNGKERQFKKVVRPVQAACQEARGCPSIPQGWRSSDCVGWGATLFPEQRYCASLKANSKTSYYYITNNKFFLMRWHYISSSKLIAEGGAGNTLLIKKYYQEKVDAIIYEEDFLQPSH